VMRGNEGNEMLVRFSYSRAEESGCRWSTTWQHRPKEAAAQASGGGRHPLGRKAMIGLAEMLG
jgi:hypothetical protein